MGNAHRYTLVNDTKYVMKMALCSPEDQYNRDLWYTLNIDSGKKNHLDYKTGEICMEASCEEIGFILRWKGTYGKNVTILGSAILDMENKENEYSRVYEDAYKLVVNNQEISDIQAYFAQLKTVGPATFTRHFHDIYLRRA